MADIYAMLFAIQLFVFIAIFFYQVYLVMNIGEGNDIKITFLLFIGMLFSFGIGFATMILGYEESLYSAMFAIETWVLPLNVILFFVLLIYHLKGVAEAGVRKAHKPRGE